MTVAGTLKFQFAPFVMEFHCAWVPLKVMVESLEQLEKAYTSMLVTVLGITQV